MTLSRPDHPAAGRIDSRPHFVLPLCPVFPPARITRLWPPTLLAAAILFLIGAGPAQAGTINLPNASFESPVVPIDLTPAIPDMDYWQKSSQPAWYDPSQFGFYPWETRMGTFYNFHTPPPDTHIDNCDGTQAAFLFAFPDVAIFQDYDSINGTNTSPSHAFNSTFSVNRAYNLVVGVLGGSGGMYDGSPLKLSLYYRDATSNMVIVAATTVTNSLELFSTNTHLVDFSVYVPGVRSSDAWAGRHIGVQIACGLTSTNQMGGYWDIDNVRLTETPLPALSDPRITNGQLSLSLQSQPGLRFEILGSTNLTLPLSNWTSLGTVSNATGMVTFADPTTNLNRRFYQARQLP